MNKVEHIFYFLKMNNFICFLLNQLYYYLYGKFKVWFDGYDHLYFSTLNDKLAENYQKISKHIYCNEVTICFVINKGCLKAVQ